MSEPLVQYEIKYQVRLVNALGDGKDGRVFMTDGRTAVKFLYEESVYRHELQAYQILQHQDIDVVNGFQVPRLLRHDNALRAIEMTIVQPPFLLDFAAAYTEDEYERLAFSDDVMEERDAHWSDVFGDRWPAVQALRDAFARETGLILLDLSLNNVRFE